MLRFWKIAAALVALLALGPVQLAAQPRISSTTPRQVQLRPNGSRVSVVLVGARLQNLAGVQVVSEGQVVDGVTATLGEIPAGQRPNRRTVVLSARRGTPNQRDLELVFDLAQGRQTITAPLQLAVVALRPTRAADPEITSPAAGDELVHGETHTITWSGVEGPEVRIDLYRGNALQDSVVAFTPNNGSFEWTVPAGVTGGNYRLVMRDRSDPNTRIPSADFAISPPPITVQVTSPADGALLVYGEGHTIAWTGVEGPEVKIDLYRGNAHQGTVAAVTPNDGSFEWSVPTGTSASNWRVVVSDLSDSWQSASSASFMIGEPPPVEEPESPESPVEVTSPAAGVVWTAGQSYTVAWTGGTGSEVSISLYVGNERYHREAGIPNTGTYEWTLPDNQPMASSARIEVRDEAIGYSDNLSFSGTFMILRP